MQAKMCDGTVTLQSGPNKGQRWGAYKHPNGEVYVLPGRLHGPAVTPCAPSLAKTYRRGQ